MIFGGYTDWRFWTPIWILCPLIGGLIGFAAHGWLQP